MTAESSVDELINIVLIWTRAYGHTRVGRPATTYIYQFCADTGYRLRDLPMSDDRLERMARECQRGLCGQFVLMIMMIIYIYLYISVNTPTQAESQPHSLERAASGIGLHVNADKTKSICFNQRGDISTLNGRSLKLVDKFIYLGSSISSTENSGGMDRCL